MASTSRDNSTTTNWSLLSPLKRAVRKIKVLLNINIHRWRLASMIGASSSRRMLSFNNRPGLRAACSDDDVDHQSSEDLTGSSRGLHRTTSFLSAAAEDDIDKKADMFISNFYRQLQMERQVSLQLRYCRGNSFDSASP